MQVKNYIKSRTLDLLKKHTAVKKMTKRLYVVKAEFKNLTFRLLQHTSSEVIVTLLKGPKL